MAKIIPLNTLTQFRPASLKDLKDARRQLSISFTTINTLFINTQYLPHLFNKVSGWNQSAWELEQHMRSSKRELPAFLTLQLEKLQGLGDEQKNANGEELDEIVQELAKELAHLLDQLSLHTRKTQDPIGPLQDSLDWIALNGFRNVLQENIEAGIKKMADADERLIKLRAIRDTITAAIDAIEGGNFASIAKDTILTVQKMTEAGMSGSKIAMVQAALEVIEKLIGSVQEGLNLLHLIGKRDELSKDIENIIEQKYADEDTVKSNGDRLQLINETEAFEKHKQTAVLSSTGLVDTLDTVIEAGRQVRPSQQDQLNAFLAMVGNFRGYLRDI